MCVRAFLGLEHVMRVAEPTVRSDLEDFDILTGQKKLLGLLTPFVLELVGMAEARMETSSLE